MRTSIEVIPLDGKERQTNDKQESLAGQTETFSDTVKSLILAQDER